MNQKAIRGQHDSSSNIIGILPRSLNDQSVAQPHGPRAYGGQPRDKNGQCDMKPTVSILLRNPEEAKRQPLPRDGQRSRTENGIPGIIQLKTAAPSRSNGQEHGAVKSPQRIPHHVQRNEAIHRQKPGSPNTATKWTRHPAWFDGLNPQLSRKLVPLFDTFVSVQQNTTALLENWSTFCEAHRQLREVFAQLLLGNLKFCCEQKVDTFFWKLLFYNVRESLKSHNAANGVKYIVHIIDEGLEFYKNLLDELMTKYLTVDDSTPHKYEVIAKVMAQKLLICSGDLHRYKVKYRNSSDYSEAAKYYREAQQLIPSNGIPYNQLAVVSILAHKKFDAIYYHMRSLMASNAIQSARESLLVLFDEIRKKNDEIEQKVSPTHQLAINQNNRSKSLRKEVWVFPDGVRRLHRSNVNNTNNRLMLYEEKRANSMSNDDLLRNFISSYLYVIGKLYCGVGMEAIHENQRKLFMQFKDILNRTPLSLTRSKLLKIVALNIFILQHNITNESRRYHSFCFFNQMFGFVVRKCNQMAETVDIEEPSQQTFIDFNTLLVYIHLYTQWLARNVDIWEPLRSDEHSCIHCWSEIQLLFPKLKKLQRQHGLKEEGNEEILEETQFCVGFTPLMPASTTFLKQHVPLKAEHNALEQYACRLRRILEFEKVYDSNQKRLIEPIELNFVEEKLDPAKKNLGDVSEMANNDHKAAADGGNLAEATPSEGDVDNREKTNGAVDPNEQISHLLKLKNELQEKTKVKKEYNEKLEKILNFVDTAVYIEVRPKYLLPDTNCFIDCLEDFERLNQESKRYSLIVPLTVVKELDGLSKGVKLESYEQNHRIHHFDDVSTRAKKSLDFIKTAKNYIKCSTTKGSIIQASMFGLVEEEYASNDDKILATAVALAKNMNTETHKDGKYFIQTELVLITTDRNLRVKALSRNLAVSEMSEFLQWTRDIQS